MKGDIRDFLHYCESTDFGSLTLSKMERHFYGRFNKEIISLCQSLPESAQTDAMLFIMRYSGINLGDELDFFSKFYPPAWSILYWLSRDSAPFSRLERRDVTNAVTAQSMAMFIHSLDDHLTDGQVSVSALTLLLRTQAWTTMDRTFRTLADGVPAGRGTILRFIDDYYSSLQDSNGLRSLDSYCDLFRKQMALGMVVPTLLSMKMTEDTDFTRDIQNAYGSFGIAWRLIDDIRDISRDMEKGVHSAIYLCLSKNVKTHWNNHSGKGRYAADNSLINVLSYVLENRLIEKIKERACTELETAASIVESYGLKGLSREFKCLANPLREGSGT